MTDTEAITILDRYGLTAAEAAVYDGILTLLAQPPDEADINVFALFANLMTDAICAELARMCPGDAGQITALSGQMMEQISALLVAKCMVHAYFQQSVVEKEY